ncbi:hypothetical protein HRbin12_01876 [bacterium HR12]|nr:hypothetical protein HRbin12_01876 [bacterium HR12]
MAPIRVRRIYEEPVPEDGVRVLVDRLWLRGMTEEGARLDRWAKELAPSPELRRWYGHRPERFEGFAQRYREELSRPEARSALEELRALARRGTLTLLTATRDVERSGARVVAEVLRRGR